METKLSPIVYLYCTIEPVKGQSTDNYISLASLGPACDEQQAYHRIKQHCDYWGEDHKYCIGFHDHLLTKEEMERESVRLLLQYGHPIPDYYQYILESVRT